MPNLVCRAVVITLGLIGPAMAQERVLISSDWGKVIAELVDNAGHHERWSGCCHSPSRCATTFVRRRPAILPSPLPAIERQLDFSTGTLGLWSSDHFVIYYRDGRVPQPGIILLGRVTGDVSIFDRPGPVTVRVERLD